MAEALPRQNNASINQKLAVCGKKSCLVGNTRQLFYILFYYFLAAAAISAGVPSMVSTMSFLVQTWAQRPQESHRL